MSDLGGGLTEEEYLAQLELPRRWTLGEHDFVEGCKTDATYEGPDLTGGEEVEVIELEPILGALQEIELRGYHPAVRRDVRALLKACGRQINAE
jgi:hypothetical protein